MTPWLTVVIPTIGRESLEVTLASIRAQADAAGVEVLVVGDLFGGYSYPLMAARDRTQALGYKWLEHDAELHCYGQPQRTYGARQALGEWVAFTQDDNILAEGALSAIWMAVCTAPRKRPLFFRMLAYWREQIWRSPELQLGNIDADCLVFPREVAQRVEWGLRYEGDFDAARQAFTDCGGDVSWVDEVISISRPQQEHFWWNR